MKNFKSNLEKFCIDYFTKMEQVPTFKEVEDLSNTDLCEIIWKSLNQAMVNRRNNNVKKHSLQAIQEECINGVRVSKAREFIIELAKSILNKQICDIYNTLTYLFKLCNTYGFDFAYGTRAGTHNTVEHNEDCRELVIGFSINKRS